MAIKPFWNQINIVCGDLDASRAFYERLGVDLPEGGVWRTASGPQHVEIKGLQPKTGVNFELESPTFFETWGAKLKGRKDLKGRVVVGFAVTTREAVDEIYQDMTSAGYRGLEAPYDAFWGARYAMLEDPDGVVVGIQSPKTSDWASDPPAL